MRISDWSSDVCSSDLEGHRTAIGAGDGATVRRILKNLDRIGAAKILKARFESAARVAGLAIRACSTGSVEDEVCTLTHINARVGRDQIGRATCRERVCQNV